MHGGAGGSGALGLVSLVAAAAGGGISGGGRAEIPAPDSGIFFRCGWVREDQRFLLARVRLPVTEFPPAVVYITFTFTFTFEEFL